MQKQTQQRDLPTAVCVCVCGYVCMCVHNKISFRFLQTRSYKQPEILEQQFSFYFS